MLEDILTSGFESYGLTCSSDTLKKYRTYFEALEETNKVMNLTAISGETDVAQLHFLDCAYLLKTADFSGKTVYDIGTGAGFPGLAMKIACPEMKLTLLDSLDKRVGFLRSTCDALGFADVECIHARAEEITPDRREMADIVTSRAVAELNKLAELCLPYVRPGGIFLAMKGPDYDAELENAKKCIRELGGKTDKCVTYTIPGTEVSHSVIIIRKVSPTPAKYPRRWAQIKKAPL